MDDEKKLDDTKLPPISDFFDTLNNSPCTRDRYIKAHRAWEEFNCTKMSDYMLAYLQLDIFQLTDVFENFRKIAINEDEVDPLNFYGIPGWCK